MKKKTGAKSFFVFIFCLVWGIALHSIGFAQVIDCACSSSFSVGNRVVLSSGGGPPLGTEGTVVCGSEGTPPLLVEWDDWFDGHNGNGNCDCGATPGPSSSMWFHACDAVTPTLVNLVSFTCEESEGGVLLEWETASEIDNAGFHLWRGEAGGSDSGQITETLILATGSPIEGAEYSYEDMDAAPGVTYLYELEDIDTNGASTLHGPCEVTMKPLFCGTLSAVSGLAVFSLVLPFVAVMALWFRRRDPCLSRDT